MILVVLVVFCYQLVDRFGRAIRSIRYHKQIVSIPSIVDMFVVRSISL